MTGHRDKGFLMVLRSLDSLIQPNRVCPGQSALVDDYQVAGLNKRPLQAAVHITANLAHARMPPLACTRGTSPA